MNFMEEYRRRLRRLCGVVDDSLEVEGNLEQSWEGCCDTCMTPVPEFTIYVYEKNDKGKRICTASKSFEYYEQFERALAKVEVDEKM